MIKAVLRSLLLLLIFFVGFVSYLLTPSGLRFGIDVAKELLPGKLSIHNISGVVLGPLTLNKIRYQDKQQVVTIKRINLNWHPLNLLKKDVVINDLTVNDLHIVTHPKNTPLNAAALKNAMNEVLNAVTQRYSTFHLLIDKAVVTNITVDDVTHKTTSVIPKLLFHGVVQKDKINVVLSSTVVKPVSLAFSLSVLGTQQQYTIETVLKGEGTDWSLLGEGDTHKITLHTARTSFLNGKLSVDTQMMWGAHLKWSGQLHAVHIHPALINPDWMGALSLNIESEGNNANNTITTNNDIRVETALGTAHVLIKHNHTWHINWHVSTQALSYWFENDKGDLDSRGTLAGDLQNPVVDATVTTHLNFPNHKVEQATLSVKGTLQQHHAHVSLLAPDQQLSLDVDGQYDVTHENWRGVLQTASISLTDSTIWQLQKAVPVDVDIEKTTYTLGDFCLISQRAGSICAKGVWSPKKMVGDLRLHITHFDWLHSYAPTLHISPGDLFLTLTANGTAAAPNVNGSIRTNGATIVFPRLNVALSNISGKITSAARIINFDILSYAKKEALQLHGSIDTSQPQLTAKLALKANNVLIVDTDQYVVYANAALTGTVLGNNLLIQGDLTIPKATIHPNDFQTTVTLPDRDIVYIGQVTHPPKSYWNLQSDFTLHFGNDVKIDVAGASTNLGGSILFTQMSQDEAATGNGDIFLRHGIYNVYGQTLHISSDSSLSYSDSLLNNPTLNIKASKIIDSIGSNNFSRDNLVVGVEIRGTVKTPKISFFSNRSSLSQADILSYILLGYGESSNTPGNTDFLLRALSAVNITSQGLLGKQNIASQIQRGLGLSEMGVESDTTIDTLGNPLNRQSAFVVGKSLSRNLYVRYSISIGMLDQGNVFQLRYLIDKNWALQSESSTLGNGADVLYTIEKN